MKTANEVQPTPKSSQRPKNSFTDPSLMFALGPLAAVLLAGGLVSLRDDIGVTNVALLISLVVIVAAIADRAAGVATAVVAAISYNFFHTVPYRSLRISNGRDIFTVVLLVVIGLVVGEISARSREALKTSRRLGDGERALEVSSQMLASGASVAELWEVIRNDLIRLLRIEDCRYEPTSSSAVPLIERTGAMSTKSRTWSSEGFELPASGAAIPVRHAGADFGQIVLIPREHSGSVLDERRVAIALADQLAVAVALADRTN